VGLGTEFLSYEYITGTLRAITTDERVYRQPSKFFPDRYLPVPEGYGEPFPSCAFGYGRRCIYFLFNLEQNSRISLGYVQVVILP
jgi:hypothetical protein